MRLRATSGSALGRRLLAFLAVRVGTATLGGLDVEDERLAGGLRRDALGQGKVGDMDDLKVDGADGDQQSDAADAARRASRGVDGEMTEEEAARTVDSVEEGRPRVVARPGAAGDKDW